MKVLFDVDSGWCSNVNQIFLYAIIFGHSTENVPVNQTKSRLNPGSRQLSAAVVS
jgi:hypothetical protein